MAINIPLTRVFDLMPAVAALESLSGPAAVKQQLQALSISGELLNQPVTLIPIREIGVFYENAARFLGVKDLGTYATRSFTYNDYGAMGRYVTQGKSLREALQRIGSAMYLYASGARYSLSEPVDRGEQAVFRYQSDAANIIGWPHIANNMLVLTADLIHGYAGDRPIPYSVDVNYSVKHRSVELEELLSTSIRYGTDSLSMSFPAHFLNLTDSNRVATSKILTFGDLARSLIIAAPDDVIGTIMQVMRLELLFKSTTINRLGLRMDLRTRTLQRILKSEGCRYRDLICQLRSERARELIRDTNLSNLEISSRLGYSAPSHFARAFKNIEAMTPTAYRKLLSKGPN